MVDKRGVFCIEGKNFTLKGNTFTLKCPPYVIGGFKETTCIEGIEGNL